MPAFNEVENIEPAAIEADAFLSRAVAEYEVILVDDGSTDGTAERIREVAAMLPSVRGAFHAENRGYGAALITGFGMAAFPHVAFTDSDRQFDMADLSKLAGMIDDCDFVVGYRASRNDTLARRIYSRSYRLLIRLLFGLRSRDLNCALKLMDREKLLALDLKSHHYFINVEILVKAKLAGYLVQEIPVRHLPRAAGRSKVDLGEIPRTIAEVVRLRAECLGKKSHP